MIDESTLILKMKKKYNGLTYREISEVTGLNISRVFRIFNGSKITYNEALTLHQLLNMQSEDRGDFINSRNAKKIDAKIFRLTRLEKISEGGN